MNHKYILVLDTETAGTEKPFVYDVGYTITDVEYGEGVVRRHFMVEQVWHNKMLFATAYYAKKRPSYTVLLRDRKMKMMKYGHIMQALAHDIKKYDIDGIYAYNCAFDKRVIEFNCDWYGCKNPVESLPFYDIWGYASKYLFTERYIKFCKRYNYTTESKTFWSTSAETCFRYIMKDPLFAEKHMGLYDALIECTILLYIHDKYHAPLGQSLRGKTLPRDDMNVVIKTDGAVGSETNYSKVYKTVKENQIILSLK